MPNSTFSLLPTTINIQYYYPLSDLFKLKVKNNFLFSFTNQTLQKILPIQITMKLPT